jgi:hypothetical protein
MNYFLLVTCLWKHFHGKRNNYICLKTSDPCDLSHKNPRGNVPYFTKAITASVYTEHFQYESLQLDLELGKEIQ